MQDEPIEQPRKRCPDGIGAGGIPDLAHHGPADLREALQHLRLGVDECVTSSRLLFGGPQPANLGLGSLMLRG